eukprot:CAMPEP_0172168250 /NCGR_PEP_ID=MMETSP1050-20130122/10029_1 /TAXON_ID=233186 /ORGANISM="Cryptomonas curvata, Strain CCAP979/52" /LENGTH=94 /DNA_ID=CAMNT_0012839143 /DNA_START=24 /DNA_END=304 /DNA_ORIENTATION=+
MCGTPPAWNSPAWFSGFPAHASKSAPAAWLCARSLPCAWSMPTSTSMPPAARKMGGGISPPSADGCHADAAGSCGGPTGAGGPIPAAAAAAAAA